MWKNDETGRTGVNWRRACAKPGSKTGELEFYKDEDGELTYFASER